MSSRRRPKGAVATSNGDLAVKEDDHAASTLRRRHVRLPIRIRPGTRLSLEPGKRLRALVLAQSEGERIAIELVTGAFVRIQPTPLSGVGPGPGDDRPERVNEDYLDGRIYPDDRTEKIVGPTIVEFTVADIIANIDPARPEAVIATGAPTRLAQPRRRSLRRLCRAVAAREQRGATILGSRGPSLAYVDLDVSAPSVMLVRVGWKALELMATNDTEVALALTWGGTTQIIPVVDPRARAAAFAHRPRSLRGDPLAGALGFRAGFVLVGLDRVRGGHVRKVVFAILPK